MRLLWVKSDVLLPLDSGGKLRTWHLLRHVASHHDVTYLGCASLDQPQAEIDGMREVARTLHVIRRRNTPKGSWRFYASAAMHLADPLPYAVGKYRSRAFRQRLEALLRDERFDLIVCDFLVPAVNLPRRLPCPSVIFTHNVEAEIWRRHAETARGRLARLLYRVQHQRMLRFERHTLARFDGVLAVSDIDRDTFARLYPGTIRRPVEVIPTGVDTRFFGASAGAPGSKSLVFTGSMDWLPNEDAMLFFCNDVLPLIRREEPNVTVSIVGRAPTASVVRLAQIPGVVVTGRVDDVRPHMADAAAYIVPLRIGGGTRLKIFEAMSMGKAIVSTSVGAEGLPVTHGAHLLIADEPRAFADAVVRLLRDVPRRRSIEAAARRLVVEHYDWAAVGGVLEQALGRFARPGAAREPRGVAAALDATAVGANESYGIR
jgi:sugar transferase (PEP-CTERM/EpsH1 system associated)